MTHDILKYDGKIIPTEKLRLWASEYAHLPVGNTLQRLYEQARKYPKIRLKLGPNFGEKLNPLFGMNGFDRFANMRMPEGMNKPLNEAEYKLITRTVINTLKQNDIAFSMPWKTRLEKGKKYYTIAYRWDRKIPYKGKLNQLVLSGLWPFTPPLNNPYFLTKGQIKKAGGKLKPGAEGKPAFFYNVLYRTPKKLREKGLDFRTYKREEMRRYLIEKAGIKPEEADKYISYYCTVPFLKHYIVYNGDDVEGIDFKLGEKSFEGEISGTHVYESKEKNPVAEAIAKAYPEPQPKIRHKFQDEAYYNPVQDVVMMPQMKQFKNSAQYYGTLFHELVHSTGHPSRLNRLKKTKFGEKDYAFEELVAELGAVYLSGLAGFLYDNIKNSAAYLKSWKSRLIKNMQDDDRFIVMAASKAQKAVDFMTENLDRNKLEKLKKQAPKPEKKETKSNNSQTKKPGKTKASEKKSGKKATAVKQRSNKLTKARIITYLRSIAHKLIPFVQVGPDGIFVSDGVHTAVYKPKDIKLPGKTVRLPHELFLKQLKDITEIRDDGSIIVGKRKLTLPPVNDERTLEISKEKFTKAGMYPGERLMKISAFVSNDEFPPAYTGVFFDTEKNSVVATNRKMLVWDPAKLNRNAPSFILDPGGRANGTKKYKFPPVDIEFHKGERLIRLKYSDELEAYAVPVTGVFPKWEIVVPEKKKAKWQYEVSGKEIADVFKQTLTALPRKKDGLIKFKLLKDKWIWQAIDLKNDKLLFTTEIKARLKKGEPGQFFGALTEQWEKILKWLENADTWQFDFQPDHKGDVLSYVINDTVLSMAVQIDDPGMNMPGLGFPGEILEVENDLKDATDETIENIVLNSLNKYFNENIEIKNFFLDKPIHFDKYDDTIGKNIKGRQRYPLTVWDAIAYKYLPKMLQTGIPEKKEPAKPHHRKKFGAKWKKTMNGYLYIDGKLKRFRITIFERNYDHVFYFLKYKEIPSSREIKNLAPKSPALPKGSSREQDLQDKNKSKNKKNQAPDKENNSGLEAPAVINLKTLKNKRFQTWKLPKEPLAKFLGDIERKENGSIAVTLDAPQGAGKTRMLFQFADMFARNGHKVLFFSLEEHPESRLFVKKVKEYISPKAEKNIYVTGEVPENWRDIIREYDVILIDSWNKLYKEVWEKEGRRLDFDYDLRRRYDGKLFIVVFQRTQDGKMRGGSQAQFDGDIILKIDKRPDFRKNEVYYDKNRYMIDNYRWNIYEKKLMRNEAEI